MKTSRTIFIVIIILLIWCTLFSGCVEVTPPSGQNNAQSYGPTSQENANIKNLIKDQNASSSNPNPTSASAQGEISKQPGGTASPEAALPLAENESFVKVTPRDYSHLKQEIPTSYLPYNRPVSTSDRQYVTIYELLNQTFANNASAYAYHLVTPPLYIEMAFYPKMAIDEQEVYKRTGNKEGTIKYTKIRPAQDAWFEMRVYDRDTNEEILREGYGKTYSLTNKTAAIRRSGNFQFDFLGDSISADIVMKIPVNSSTVTTYSEIHELMEEQKTKSELIPPIYLTREDLGEGWQQTGELIHTPRTYSSIFVMQSTGSKLTQEITQYSNISEAETNYAHTKTVNSGETLTPITAGDEGYGFESIRKTSVVFRQGVYLVQLVSYSIPPVSFDELKRLANVVSERITHI